MFDHIWCSLSEYHNVRITNCKIEDEENQCTWVLNVV